MQFLKRISIVIFSGVLVVFISVLADRVIGEILNSRGYFTALPPGKTLRFETSEFNTIATISAQGIRNDIVVTPKPAGVYRILALGDSFTFGWGVDSDESWPKQLEKTAKNTEIINAGAPGIELSRINMICRAYAKRFDVDAIIVALYTDDILQAGDFLESQSPLEKMQSVLWPTLLRLKDPIVEKSYFEKDVSFEWKRMANSMMKKDPTTLLTLSPHLRDDFLEGKINPQFIQLAHQTPQFYQYLFSQEFMEIAMREIEYELASLRTCIKNVPITIVSIPASALIAQQYQKAMADLGFTMSPELLNSNPDEAIEKLAKKLHIRFISLLSDFRSDGCPGCYYLYDGHLTQYGHERVRKMIQSYD